MTEMPGHLRPDVLKNLVPVPSDGPLICPMCHSWRYPAARLCSNCAEVCDTLTDYCGTIVPIAIYSKPSEVRDWLKFYKDDAANRESYTDYIVEIISMAIVEKGDKLRDLVGGWERIAVVPSTTKRVFHPLERQLQRAGLGDWLCQPLIRTNVPLAHRVMADTAYAAVEDVTEWRILLIDDVYTTGARSQSAASALQLAGANVVAIVPIGRRINPSFNEVSQIVWDRQRVKPFSLEELFEGYGCDLARPR
jgi:hypothetical protein